MRKLWLPAGLLLVGAAFASPYTPSSQPGQLAPSDIKDQAIPTPGVLSQHYIEPPPIVDSAPPNALYTRGVPQNSWFSVPGAPAVRIDDDLLFMIAVPPVIAFFVGTVIYAFIRKTNWRKHRIDGWDFVFAFCWSAALATVTTYFSYHHYTDLTFWL